jgi:hypothetical protein
MKREQQRNAAALGRLVISATRLTVLVTSLGPSHQPAGRGTYAIRALRDLCLLG